MEANRHVLIYGDAFVDYIATTKNNDLFDLYLGGATVNVSAGVSRLGVPSAFITITGDDEISGFFCQALRAEGVDLTHSIKRPEKRISGVYIHLTEANDRVFASYDNETPDLQVKADELAGEAFESASLFHFCSGTLFHPEARETTAQALVLAKSHGVICSYDVNIRPLRWESEELCRQTVLRFLPQADILKLTVEELLFLMEADSMEAGIERLKAYGLPVVFVTDGEHGTNAVFKDETIHVPVVPVQPVDTTGAGDAFMAGIIRHVHLSGMPQNQQELIACAGFGNKLGALCATRAGAITAMPRSEDMEDWE
ncbi:carbohydrate kinase [Planococcus sp. CP5-4]|uniref:carbohydrate kinase family protein n=1 Tax=unclassified Planococcus (in: firmicutes) TaxID=2662419 RepID=UPI001C22DF85|nr:MULTISPECIES: carbohydrate kinase [unclassified Planococcus (in: firmicutes)]MBU9673225.1 carbohydrate kinase [Planococcus sp. CP5-4_YE]MBW6062533.1 carbohydrate kinase [Planococcus sp. CP5-4]